MQVSWDSENVGCVTNMGDEAPEEWEWRRGNSESGAEASMHEGQDRGESAAMRRTDWVMIMANIQTDECERLPPATEGTKGYKTIYFLKLGVKGFQLNPGIGGEGTEGTEKETQTNNFILVLGMWLKLSRVKLH